MSVENTANLLQAINATIPGINAAPPLDSYPQGELDTLPIALTWPGDGQYRLLDGGAAYEDERDFWVFVYYDLIFQENYPYAKTQLAGLLGGFRAKYLNPATYVNSYDLSLQTGDPHVRVMRERPFRDLSIDDEDSILVYGGPQYHGFKFVVRVLEEGTLS